MQPVTDEPPVGVPGVPDVPDVLVVSEAVPGRGYGAARAAAGDRAASPCVTRAAGATVGVEEEYHLVDPTTLALRAEPAAVARARDLLGEHAHAEITQTQLEVSTPVCSGLAELRAALRRARRAAAQAAGAAGCAILGAASHPFATWQDLRITPHPRYSTCWSAGGCWPASRASPGATSMSASPTWTRRSR